MRKTVQVRLSQSPTFDELFCIRKEFVAEEKDLWAHLRTVHMLFQAQYLLSLFCHSTFTFACEERNFRPVYSKHI